MLSAGRSRVSIGDLAGLIALAGVVLAPRVRHLRTDPGPETLTSALLEVALASIFFVNRRLSRWMWLVLASLCLRPVFDLLWQQYLIGWEGFSNLLGGMVWLWVSHFFLALFLAGLALMFRDIRRQLAAVEPVRKSPDPAPSPDGDAVPAGVS